MALNLPHELRDMIIDRLDAGDLASLCRVSKQFYRFAIPYLSREITVRVDENLAPTEWSKAILQGDLSRFRFTQTIAFESPNAFDGSGKSTCFHAHNIDDTNTSQGTNGITWVLDDTKLKAIEDQLRPFIDCLGANTLRGFKWNMRTCIPERLMSYLKKQQNSIERLHLITDPYCEYELVGGSGNSWAAGWNKLRELSWPNIQSIGDASVVRTLINPRILSKTMKKLSLGVCQWHNLAKAWDVSNPGWSSTYSSESLNFVVFIIGLLGWEPSMDTCILPDLAELSLFRISFEGWEREERDDFCRAISFNTIRTLRLVNCDNWVEVLDTTYVTDVSQNMELEKLEVVVDPGFDKAANCDLMDLGEWASSVPIQHAHIVLPLPGGYLWNNAIDLKPKKSLLLHSRAFDNHRKLIDASSRWEPVFGSNDDPFARRRDSLGVSCGFQQVRNDIEWLAQVGTTFSPPRILHFRTTNGLPTGTTLRSYSKLASDDGHLETEAPKGKESTDAEAQSRDKDLQDSNKLNNEKNEPLEDFAQWAFGPDSLIPIEILAFGDFSERKRNSKGTRLLCKRETPVHLDSEDTADEENTRYFRDIRRDDYDLQQLIKENIHVLAACPFPGSHGDEAYRASYTS